MEDRKRTLIIMRRVVERLDARINRLIRIRNRLVERAEALEVIDDSTSRKVD